MPPQVVFPSRQSAERPLPHGIVIRKARAADHALIFSSWLSSMKDSMVDSGERPVPVSIRVTNPVFSNGQHLRIERLLADPATEVRCASLLDDMDVVVGWAIARENCLHYVFVKSQRRQMGLATQLIRAAAPSGVQKFACRTKQGDSFIVPRLVGAVYDPFAIDPRAE